jgi:hypothetical protein
VPAALKGQWIREWEATTSKVPITEVEGRAEERARLFRSTKHGFPVMNYEQLLRGLESVHQFGPGVVVLDEAQRIKNWATKSSAYVMTLRPEWRLVLTGTPMENRLEELATLLDWVDDVALAPKWQLTPWYTAWIGDGEHGRHAAAAAGRVLEADAAFDPAAHHFQSKRASLGSSATRRPSFLGCSTARPTRCASRNRRGSCAR